MSALPEIVRAIEQNVIHLRWFYNTDSSGNVNNDLTLALTSLKPGILEKLKTEGQRFDNNVKWYIAANVEVMKAVHTEEGPSGFTFSTISLHGRSKTIVNLEINEDMLEDQWNESCEKMTESLARFVQNGSGWSVSKIINIDLNIVRYRPLHGASMSSYLSLPSKLAKRKAVINIKNPHDKKCFLWSILTYLCDQTKQDNYSLRYLERRQSKVDMEGIEYPVKLKDINRFENQNPNIAVNVYGYEENEDRIYPLRVTEHRDSRHMIHLLLLTGETREQFHYCLINTKPGFNGLSRLLSNLTNHKSACHYCPYCLHRFSSDLSRQAEEKLNKHITECKKYGTQRVRIPEVDKEREAVMRFRDFSPRLRGPFTVYADFESFIVPIDTSTPAPNTSFTNQVAQHLPSGYCYIIVDEEGEIFQGPVIHRAERFDENIVEKMLSDLLKEGKRLHKIMTTEKILQEAYARSRFYIRNRHLFHRQIKTYCRQVVYAIIHIQPESFSVHVITYAI